jgi:uncharacterized membrane protein
MNKVQLTFAFGFAAILILAGVNHFINPQMYSPFIPDWMPLLLTNIFTGIIEVGLGAGLLLKKNRKIAAFGVFILMLLFLPLHLADVFKEHPAIGSKTVAIIRLPIQFLLIWCSWYIYKPKNQKS